MKRLLSAAVLFATIWIASGCVAQVPVIVSDSEYVKNTLYPATVLLYTQKDDGTMKMVCTSTAIKHDGDSYTFVSASHCICEDNEEKTKAIPAPGFYFVTDDKPNSKEFIPAKIVGCGYQHRGDDFSLFEVKSDKVFPVIPLGKDPVDMEAVVNVASPLGLGKQIFAGTVSSAKIDRPVLQGDINWSGAVFLQLFGVAGGSSGSSVVCLDQREICAFIVGAIGGTNIVAMPVSRLTTFMDKLSKDEYKYYQAGNDAEDIMDRPKDKKKK